MPLKKGFLDQFTSVDELLIENTKQIARLVELMQGEEDRDLKIVFYTYPSDGTYIALSAGTLVLDFGVGTINTNGIITAMSHSLQSDYKDFLRSIFVDSDKDIIVQLGTQDKIPVKEGKQLLATYQQFKKVTITTTVPTNVFVLCCTNPEAIIQFVNYAMVLKDPDDVFGNPTFIGNAELAARLGSIKTFEKRGEVVLMDNFEDSTLKWDTYPAGAGSITKSIDSMRSGNYSLKIVNIDGSSGYIVKSIPYSSIGKLGFEFSFTHDNHIDNTKIEVYVYTGTKSIFAGINFNWAEGTLKRLEYIDAAAEFQPFATSINIREANFLFYPLKFVIDVGNLKYVRCSFLATEHDLSAYSLYNIGDTSTAPHLSVKIYADAYTGEDVNSYFDDFIVTQNEP